MHSGNVIIIVTWCSDGCWVCSRHRQKQTLESPQWEHEVQKDSHPALRVHVSATPRRFSDWKKTRNLLALSSDIKLKFPGSLVRKETSTIWANKTNPLCPREMHLQVFCVLQWMSVFSSDSRSVTSRNCCPLQESKKKEKKSWANDGNRACVFLIILICYNTNPSLF